MIDTKTYPVKTIVAVSEELDRVTTLLLAIEALRPKDSAAFDNATAVYTLALECLETVSEVQNTLFAVEGEAA